MDGKAAYSFASGTEWQILYPTVVQIVMNSKVVSIQIVGGGGSEYLF